jgi:hypothetical protein
MDGRASPACCYICVRIFIIFYMFVVFGVMVFKKTDLREFASLLTALSTRCFAFSRAFLPFCASRFFASFCRLRKAGPAFLNDESALRE